MKRSIAKGTPEQFLNLVQNKIAELGGDVEACDKITSAYETNDNPNDFVNYVDAVLLKLKSVGCDVTDGEVIDYAEAAAELIANDDDHDVEYWWSETKQNFMDEVDELPHVNASAEITSARDDDSTYDDRFIHTLMGDIEAEVSGEVDGLTFDTLENSLSVTVVHGGEVTQFTVPHDDLSFDFDTMSDDVDYIVKTIRETLDSDSFSSDDEVADIDTELSDIGSATNTCGVACKPEVLSSVNGDVIHGLTWAGLIQELSERGYEVDAAYRRSPDQWIVAYKDGRSYDIEVTRYSEGDYEVHPDNISEVIEADTDVYKNDDINDDVLVGFSEIASKSVPDSDGFSTDYTMYLDTNTGEYVFVFGDKDVYSPADGNFDWQCETEEEAWEWFNSYKGFADDDDVEAAEEITAATDTYQLHDLTYNEALSIIQNAVKSKALFIGLTYKSNFGGSSSDCNFMSAQTGWNWVTRNGDPKNRGTVNEKNSYGWTDSQVIKELSHILRTNDGIKLEIRK